MLLTAVLTLIPLLAAVPLGLLGGCLAGLKMGCGESVGPWSWVDRFFNVNRGHRESTTSGTGAARRKRRSTGAPEPDLMSVDTQGEATGGSRSASSTSRRKR